MELIRQCIRSSLISLIRPHYPSKTRGQEDRLGRSDTLRDGARWPPLSWKRRSSCQRRNFRTVALRIRGNWITMTSGKLPRKRFFASVSLRNDVKTRLPIGWRSCASPDDFRSVNREVQSIRAQFIEFVIDSRVARQTLLV